MSESLLAIVQYLLPGFITAWIFHGLTAYPKESQFERVIQALVFMAIVQTLFVSVKASCLAIGRAGFSVGKWSTDVDHVLPTVVAILLGLVVSAVANSDWLFKVLRDLNITKKSALPTVWYRAFYCNHPLAIFHLNGERRLKGWVSQYPSDPKDGYFEITWPEWQTEDELGRIQYIAVKGVSSFLIKSESVDWVEFLEEGKAKTDGESTEGT